MFRSQVCARKLLVKGSLRHTCFWWRNLVWKKHAGYSCYAMLLYLEGRLTLMQYVLDAPTLPMMQRGLAVIFRIHPTVMVKTSLDYWIIGSLTLLSMSIDPLWCINLLVQFVNLSLGSLWTIRFLVISSPCTRKSTHRTTEAHMEQNKIQRSLQKRNLLHIFLKFGKCDLRFDTLFMQCTMSPVAFSWCTYKYINWSMENWLYSCTHQAWDLSSKRPH